MGDSRLPVCDVLGVGCVVGDVVAAADAVIERALSGAGGYGVLCNVHVLMTAQREPEVMAALESAWTVFPDGAPVAWAERRSGATFARRVGGPDLMPAVLDKGRGTRLRHVLFGSTPDVVSALASRLRQGFPGVNIVGAWAPEANSENSACALGRIRAAKPDVVWVALGAPKQELWMHRHAEEIAPAIALGVGAAFDFHAGTRKRAPSWMQRAGLEWAHRMVTEPRRLGPRYLRTNTEFVLRVSRGMIAARSQRIDPAPPFGNAK